VDTAAAKTCGQRSFLPSVRRPIGNESALKIMVNNIINLLFLTAISILAISNHNSFPALFDKKSLPYILFEIYIYILTLEMTSPGNRHCANCIGTLS